MTKKQTLESPEIGSGIYSVADAARIIGVTSGKLQQWLKPERPLFPKFFEPNDRTLSFLELMELLFVKMFRSEGVSLQIIRRAAQTASTRFQTDYPFAVKRFDTDGAAIFATMLDEKADATMLEDIAQGQYVFEQICRPFFHKIEYRGTHEALRYWPLDRRGRVVLDPHRKFGKPIDSQTGIPTRSLYAAVTADGGQSHKAVAEWYAVPVEAVDAAVRFEQSLAN